MKRIGQHEYFIGIAKTVSRRSACLSRQVGCVLVDKHNHILATGYNGPPSGVDHCALCHRKESGRDLYDCMAVHAEMNALLQCPNVQEIVIAYVSVNPCKICMRLLANTPCQIIAFKDVYTTQSLSDFTRFWQGRLGRKIIKVR